MVGGLVVSGRVVGTRDPRLNVLRAVPILVVISLAFTTVYTVYTFGLAAVQGVPRASIWAQGLADPTASRCGAAAATEVLDPFTAVPLAEAPGLPAPPPATGFVNGGGYYAGNRPQGVAGERVWGSLVARDGVSAERTEGEVTTPWYALPDAAAGAGGTVTVIAAGSLADGVRLTAEYGRRAGDTVEAAGTEVLTDAAHDASWRTLTLEPTAGADLVRLVGVDASGAIHGWLAFSAPVVARPVALADLLPRDAPVALGWPLAFGWPCQRQPGIVNGITEPAAFGVLWGASGPLSGFSDGAFQPSRGGAFAQLSRSQSVLRAGDGGTGRPERAGRRVRQPPGPRPLHADREPADRERHVDGDRPTPGRLNRRLMVGRCSRHRGRRRRRPTSERGAPSAARGWCSR